MRAPDEEAGREHAAAEDERFVLEAIADLIAEAKAGRVTGRTLTRAETALDALELVLTK